MGKIRLTPEGVELLERHVVKEFIRIPKEIRAATDALDLNLDEMIGRYLTKYFEIEDDLRRIRSGSEPTHNPPGYYSPNW